MSWKEESKRLLLIAGVFLACFYLPVEWLRDSARLKNAHWEALHLVRSYAREHFLLCLVPAFFFAGAVGAFISRASVMGFLGAKANKFLAYGVASVSGSVLAVCSCTVLPLFAGIYRMGAGLGPACAFLYSGPAINVLAIILTARVLGFELGAARAIGAIVFSVVIGLAMHVIFRKEDLAKAEARVHLPKSEVSRPLWQTSLVFASMLGVLIFANWAKSGKIQFGVACCPLPGALHVEQKEGMKTGEDRKYIYIERPNGEVERIDKGSVRWEQPIDHPASAAVYAERFALSGLMLFALIMMLARWFQRSELSEWALSSWGFAKQMLPPLLLGVLIAGGLLGRPGHEALIPSEWVTSAVGGNSLSANFFASIAGAFMYFATLSEVPIVQGLTGNGMGKGPALALLLAGPAISLPNMLVIRSVLGTKKTIVFVALVVVMATVSGMIYGTITGG